MTISYRVHLTDRRQQELAGSAGERYGSPPHGQQDALTLARLLLGVAQLPEGHADGHGPWRQAIPGGQRIVWLEPELPA